MRFALSAITAALLTALPASASPIFTDNFNADNAGNGALNYAGFTNWNVTNGSVDLIGDGTSHPYLLVGNGLYVDLDGTTNDAGIFSTKQTFEPGSYKVEFDLAGN